MKPHKQVQGTVAAGFEPVRDAFQNNLAEFGEIGASFVVEKDGERLVDLWGGLADRNGRAWEADTTITIFSTTKGLVALCFLLLADRELLNYDRLVGDYWPNFAHYGKENITVRQLLNHVAGLPAVDEPMDADIILDRDRLCRILEEQEPLWEPGTKQAYGAIAWGLYAAELFWRVAGESAGTFFAREIATPLNADAWIGIPAEEQHRVATLYPVGTLERIAKMLPHILFRRTSEARMGRSMLNSESATRRAFLNPPPGPEGMKIFNDPEIQREELLWANAIASARGLATIYATLAAGGKRGEQQLVREETLQPLFQAQTWSMDGVLFKEQGWSQGFLKDRADLFSPVPEHFGHPGMGGAFAFADPVNRIGFSYVMNRMDYRLRSPRCIRLCHALYRCL